MIRDPLAYVERFAAAGSNGITFHYESESEPEAVIEKIRACGLRVGMSIRPGVGRPYPAPAVKIDMLLIMTVEPGFGGQVL